MHYGFIVAMEEEATVFSDLFPVQGEKLPHKCYQVIQYCYNDSVFTVIISGIGKSFAASATTVLLQQYGVDCIINIGSAGGLNCNIGDIIISNEAKYHDVDVTAFGYTPGQVPKQPVIFTAKQDVICLSELLKSQLQGFNVQNGLIVTGDQFINDPHKVELIKQNNVNVKALDMEAAAIAQVCHNYEIDFILIKKISDLADHQADVTFTTEISHFENNVKEIIKKMIQL